MGGGTQRSRLTIVTAHVRRLKGIIALAIEPDPAVGERLLRCFSATEPVCATRSAFTGTSAATV
jgi:hypothetical protein